jgi:hypothetical protein
MSLESFASRPVCALRVVVLIAAAALACRGSPPPAAPPPKPAAIAARVIDQVPSDTPYAMSVDQNMLSATTLDITAVRTNLEAALREAVLSPAALASASVEDRLGSEFARELLPFDDAALRRVGWLPGESELVLYGHGLIPVVRLRADGRAANAAWKRISARADLRVPEASWHGVPYILVPPRGKRTQTIVIAFLPHQVAATLVTHPEAILDHLIDEAPAAAPLLPRWRRGHVDPQSPANPWPVMWLNPGVAAPRLRASDDLAQLGEVVPPACRAAAATAVAVVPSMSVMYWRDGDELVASYAMPLPDALRPLVVGERAVAHWLADARPGMQFAWRLPADELVAGATAIAAPIPEAFRACGDPVDDPLAALGALPLRQLRGGTVAMEVTDGEAAVVIALEALDVGALWGWLQSALPLGPFPRPGEVQAVPLMPGQTLFAIATSREVAFSLGWPAAARLQALLASGGRPAAVVLDYDQGAMSGARFLGRVLGDDGDASRRTEMTLDARGLIGRSRTPLPAGWR